MALEYRFNLEMKSKSAGSRGRTSIKVGLVFRVICFCSLLSFIGYFIWKYYPGVAKMSERMAFSIQLKVDRLKSAEAENEKLNLENARLKMQIENSNYQHQVNQSQRLTEKFQSKLKDETGSKVGRTSASINYKIPEDLLPFQQCSLAIGYFTNREFEKAALIFSRLNKAQDKHFIVRRYCLVPC
jgi:hypothetical protein